jgi:V8-like Glu-specific endopeptidase
MREVRLIALAASVVFPACSGCASGGKPAVELAAPDTSRVLKLIGRFTIASGCPVSEHLAFTAAHVVDPRPFDKDAPYTAGVFQQGGRGGTYKVLRRVEGLEAPVSWERDVAMIETEASWESYRLAPEAPEPGSTLFVVGFDWRSKRNAFAERVWKLKLLRIVAGHLIYDPAGEPGTSGSCILNEDGLVVGINTGGKYVGSSSGMSLLGAQEEVGIGVLVLGKK